MQLDVGEMLQRTRDLMGEQHVFGDPFHSNGLTLVPVAAVRGGGGGGGGPDPGGGGDGGGGGFGLIARPVGAYVIRGNEVEWRPAFDTTRAMTAGAAVVGLALLTVRAAIKARRRRPRRT